MKIKELISQKIELFKDNPRIFLYWAYKTLNLFKKNTLNNGERYDPNILGVFGINDKDQEARYNLARDMISPQDSVLDIACGTGYGALILSGKCSRITGVDISKKSIKYANKNYRTRPNINFLLSDVFSFNEQADVVVSFETIEHIGRSIHDTTSKLLELVKKKLILSVPYKETVGANRHHVHFDIDERSFEFLQGYNTTFLYQTEDGKIGNNKDVNPKSLIIIVDKV